MNPHAAQSISPLFLIGSLWQHRQLIKQMAWREVIGRYKGSIMGLLWSFINPLLMLAVYTFIFSVVFKAKWGGDEDGSKTEFALVLFAGLIMHGLLAEVLNRAPGIILGNINYVKKVVFPLEILSAVAIGAALFHSAVSLAVLEVVFLILNGYLHYTILLIPLVILPLVLLIMGFAWILASLGVFVRDIGQTIGIITAVMLFLSPIFFPISAIPEEYQIYIMMNPLTFIIEQAREVLIWGRLPNWRGLAIYSVIAILVFWLGFVWFQKTRKGFADVL